MARGLAWAYLPLHDGSPHLAAPHHAQYTSLIHIVASKGHGGLVPYLHSSGCKLDVLNSVGFSHAACDAWRRLHVHGLCRAHRPPGLPYTLRAYQE